MLVPLAQYDLWFWRWWQVHFLVRYVLWSVQSQEWHYSSCSIGPLYNRLCDLLGISLFDVQVSPAPEKTTPGRSHSDLNAACLSEVHSDLTSRGHAHKQWTWVNMTNFKGSVFHVKINTYLCLEISRTFKTFRQKISARKKQDSTMSTYIYLHLKKRKQMKNLGLPVDVCLHIYVQEF